MFYPLLGASLLALGLFAVQWCSAGWFGPRMHVNLALAWVPYLVALWAVAMRTWTKWRRWLLVLPVPIWLAFFPNAPYMVTDFMYLPRLDADTWLQIGIFMAFALCGLYLAVASLYLMHTVVRGAFGLFAGWVIVWAAIVASGAGIFVGRFLRWNSWELFTRPGDLWVRASGGLTDPGEWGGPIAFSVMLSAMLAVFYFMFLAVRKSAASPEELAVERRELTDWGPPSPRERLPTGLVSEEESTRATQRLDRSGEERPVGGGGLHAADEPGRRTGDEQR